MPEKPERVWIDPPGVEPEISLEDYGKLLEATSSPQSVMYVNLTRRWRWMFIGMVYIFTAFVIYFGQQFDFSLEIFEIMFLSVGAFFIIIALLLYKRTGESRFGWR